MITEGDRDANSKKRKAEELSPEGADDPDEDATQEEDPPQHQDASKQEPTKPEVDDDEAKVEAKEKKDVKDTEDPPSDEKKELNGDKTEENGDKMEVDEKKEESSGEKEEETGEKKRKENNEKKEEERKEKEDESGDANDENGDKEPAETPDKQETPTDDKTEEKVVKNPYDSLKWITITNDGKSSNLIKLVALKSLFAKQLPKMPRTYIARLVFDRRHTSLAIISDDPALKDTDEEVIGSICYRAFPEMRFAEIAFCAVNASHQVKGYGTKLMNLLKREGARTGIEYFITYADNYAIGYFKKQGFTKSITMPKGRYQGLIKDYDGGTMMECYVHPSIDFTRIPEMLAAQRKFILSRIRLKANSTQVYDPLPNNFSPRLEGVSRANEAAARAMAIPGMIEAGWSMTDLLAATGQGKDVDRAKNALKSELLSIVRKVEEQQFAWPFREPVDTSEVQDYLEIIKEPIDLQTIDKRIRKGDHYKSKQMLYADLMLMVNNCKLYNDEASTYVQCSVSLDKYLGTLFHDMNSRS